MRVKFENNSKAVTIVNKMEDNCREDCGSVWYCQDMCVIYYIHHLYICYVCCIKVEAKAFPPSVSSHVRKTFLYDHTISEQLPVPMVLS